MEKSPISLLSEYCQKHKYQLPTYTFIKRMDDYFECHVRVLKITAIGIASNKSDAKREAAFKLLNDDKLYLEEPLHLKDNEICIIRSHVSTLMEYCQKQCLPMPTFSWSENADTKQFICTAKAANITAIGVGQNKMNAKHDAARNVIIKLNTINKNKNESYKTNTIADREQNETTNVPSTVVDLQLLYNNNNTFDKLPPRDSAAASSAEHQYKITDITKIHLEPTKTKTNECKPLIDAMKNMSVSGDRDQPVVGKIDAPTNIPVNYSDKLNMYYKLSNSELKKNISNIKLCDRHNYFLNYAPHLKEAALKVVRTEYASTKQQALDLLKALQIKFKTQTHTSCLSGYLISIELLCEYHVIFAEQENKIYKDIVQYFNVMLF
ncbi:uncharacterized protein LOC119684523 isoform X2 [Teleopsis dalmanni]|uniref:uncharacterized protein LOC119684523 isoform X2 n=1 Tax=Teleopsis dalmanni TaxID=139649 RepID=UPI0018CE5296|nr:uncharacterized protein LOC119684523 isoform X2 [Teleopsis dalmanni]